MQHHPIHWLYQQQSGGISQSGNAVCYLCSASCTEQHSVKSGIADTFNSHYLCKAPSSPYLCDACQWYFNRGAGHPDFYKMSLIVTPTTWHNWQRADMKADITNWLTFGMEEASYLVCSLTKKKHILLQAPMNAATSRNLSIQVEEQVATLELWHWRAMNDNFMRLLAMGHNKSEILSGNLYGNTLRKHGRMIEAMLLSRELEPYRHSPAIELLSYVTIVDYDKKETTEEHDANDGTNTIGNRDGDAVPGGSAPQSGLQRNQPGVQIEVPHGTVATSRGKRGSVRPHEQHAPQVSLPSLWEVSGGDTGA